MPARGRPIVVVLALWLAAGCATVTPSPEPEVIDLDVRGERRVSERQLKRRLLTAETPWWPFAQPRRFDPLVWEGDLERIRRVYEARGFYQARVVASEVARRRADAVALTVTVDEGVPVRIARVSVPGLEALADEEVEAVCEDLPLEVGAIFTEAAWQAAKSQILARLRGLGHAEASVDGQALVDLATSTVDLSVFVRPGPRYRFGAIEVRVPGGQRVDPERVREQVRLAIGEDEIFSDEALEEAQRRVFGLGVFSSARVFTAPPDRASGRVGVVAEVREAPFRTLRAGGGIASDEIRQEARLVGGWTNRDFLGGLRRLEAQATVGWAFIPGVLAVGRDREAFARQGPIFRGSLALEQPRLLGKPALRLRGLGEGERTIEQAFDAIGGRGLVGVLWQPRARFTLFPAYHLQGYRLTGPKAQSARVAPLALGCRTDPCFVVLSYLEQVATWDRRDNPLEPRRGHLLGLSLQEGGGPLGGEFDYLRVVPEARGYVSFGEDDVFTVGARLRVGALLPISGVAEDTAVVTRFFAGGGNSMRGFNIRRLSPLLLVPAPGVTGGGPPLVPLPIGGNGLIEGSVEARLPLVERLLASFFLDYGLVTHGALEPQALRDMQWALGLGLRYLTAIGPIRVDFGFRLPIGRPPPLFDADGREITYRRLPGDLTQPGRETGGNVNHSCFGLGGSAAETWVRDGLCTFHISIGEAF